MKRYNNLTRTETFPEPPVTVRHKKVGSHDFVKAWMTSGSAVEVARKLEMNKGAVYARASSLRSQGVRLPKMPQKKDMNSVDELNKLIERYKSNGR